MERRCPVAHYPDMKLFLLLTNIFLSVYAETIVYFREQFEDDEEWVKRWVQSKSRPDYGIFQLTSGKYFGDPEKDKGIQTIQDWKFYGISARFEPFSNEGQTLVIQYTVKHEQGIDCGGGYVKLFPADLNQLQLNRESPYYIMFGPDICGTIHEKVHVIFNYKGKNHLIKKNITCKHDELTHLYTLILRPNNTYEVKIDNERVENGSLDDDWDFLLPKKIQDLNATKPLDWDERVQIVDPDDRRPDDWEETEFMPDPDSRQPVDWDSSMDGEWEPPTIPNPKYKGIWTPRIIDNPNYKGEWVRPETDNPDFVPDPTIYIYRNIGVIGLDLWQVKSGTIFDNFLITNNETFAEIVGNETWGETKDPEREMKEIQDEERDSKDEKKQRLKRLHKEFEMLEKMEKDKTFDAEKYTLKDMINRIQGKDEEKTKKIEEAKPKEKQEVQQIEGKKQEEDTKQAESEKWEVCEKQEECEEREKDKNQEQDGNQEEEKKRDQNVKQEESVKQEETEQKPETLKDKKQEESVKQEPETQKDKKQEESVKQEPETLKDKKQEESVKQEPETQKYNKEEESVEQEPETQKDKKQEESVKQEPETLKDKKQEESVNQEPETQKDKKQEESVKQEPETQKDKKQEESVKQEPETQKDKKQDGGDWQREFDEKQDTKSESKDEL
ncbi:calreticulin-like [Pelobates cultripes]|uniref:Calreticulin n=1 Tax=Pelobates cultripes TaxID=61616 RepID=A0AAD1SUU5_PELCU|nr:calreticulin-like [Pelobates cultripes]